MISQTPVPRLLNASQTRGLRLKLILPQTSHFISWSTLNHIQGHASAMSKVDAMSPYYWPLLRNTCKPTKTPTNNIPRLQSSPPPACKRRVLELVLITRAGRTVMFLDTFRSLRTKWNIRLGPYTISYYNPNMVHGP